jgi:UDP-N-acetylmuramyl pentapeptide synthase
MRLRARHDFTVVTVSGSVGKTSTKYVAASVLQQAGKRVRYQAGNYNDRVTVPLVLFDQPLPHLLNALAWLSVFAANERMIRRGPGIDIAVLELGTDGPGQIEQFAYLQPELSVVTAVTPEHMEFFADVDAVVSEELAVAKFAQKLLVAEDVPERYLKGVDALRFGLSAKAGYRVQQGTPSRDGQTITLTEQGNEQQAHIALLGKPGAKIALAGAAVARELGIAWDKIIPALSSLEPVAGRMRMFRGVHDSTIIDDTYNASPEAVIAALDVLVSMPGGYKVLVLGGMNELGDFGREAHKEAAEAINELAIDLVVSVGELANKELAPYLTETRQRKVVRMFSAERAGVFVRAQIAGKKDTVVLCKGSQNGVFAEETVKQLLLDPADSVRLVRQSSYWLRRKAPQLYSLGLLDDRL